MRGKDALGVKKRLVLVAYGLTVFGQRVLPSFRQAPSESATAWEAFLLEGGLPMRSHNVYPRGIVLAGLVLTFIGLAAQAQAATYHVNNQVACSDSNPGTPQQSVCTTGRAVVRI
jgi:hypothetical protein